jgi:hypothetical protein
MVKPRQKAVTYCRTREPLLFYGEPLVCLACSEGLPCLLRDNDSGRFNRGARGGAHRGGRRTVRQLQWGASVGGAALPTTTRTLGRPRERRESQPCDAAGGCYNGHGHLSAIAGRDGRFQNGQADACTRARSRPIRPVGRGHLRRPRGGYLAARSTLARVAQPAPIRRAT